MATTFQHWFGRSLAIVLLISTAPAFANSNGSPQVVLSAPLSEATIAMQDSLELTPWQLVNYRSADGTLVEAVSDRAATFQFQEGRLAGTTGCNRFFSAYTRDGETLTFGQGASTQMACIPEALMAQEMAILQGLPQIASFALTDQQLVLLDAEGSPLFTLRPQPTATLTDTEWVLTLYNNGRGGLVTPIIDTTITARFSTETGLTGTAGCNTYRAPYQVDNNVLTVGAAASTRRLCREPVGVMSQESDYLALLEAVAVYAIDGNQLDLKDANGTTLVRFTTNL